MVMRIAAVGDVHMDEDVVGRFRPALEELPRHADVLLLAGDLTRHGTEAEARCVAREFGGLGVPVVTVLGNHDYHCNEVPQVIRVLEDAGSPCWRAPERCWTCRRAGWEWPGPRASVAASPAAAPASSANRR